MNKAAGIMACMALLGTFGYSQENWTVQTSNVTAELRDLHVFDAQKVIAVGASGTIVMTTDGGATWGARAGNTTANLKAVSFGDVQTGWAVGTNAVLKTVDGGATWTAQSMNAGDSKSFLDVTFSNASSGWIATLENLLRTSDGGASWEEQPRGTTNYLLSVHSPDAAQAWASGFNGTIIQTNDGGNDWNQQRTGEDSEFLHAIHMLNNGTDGWVAGSGGTIMKTADGGANWTSLNADITAELYAVFAWSPAKAWMAGSGGTIVGTGDGGTTWFLQASGVVQILYGIHFANDGLTGWAVGGGGTILKTTNAGGTAVQRPTPGAAYGVKGVVQGPFTLAMEGRIYTINAEAASAMSIADLTGRLVNKSKVTSSNLAWDGRDLHGNAVPAGAYILELSGGDRHTSHTILVDR